MRTTLSILEKHLEVLNNVSIQRGAKNCYLLCGNSKIESNIWDSQIEVRFLSRYPIYIQEQSDNTYFQEELDSICFQNQQDIISKAIKENLHMCFIRKGIPLNERPKDASSVLFNQDLDEFITHGLYVLVLYIDDQSMNAFIRSKNGVISEMSFIRIIGSRFRFYYPDKFTFQTPSEFNRQELAFGNTLTGDLSNIRIGIIGCGATGSATCQMLIRLGVGCLLLIDKDKVEVSNLNRLYGATLADANEGALKVNVLKKSLDSIGLNCNIKVISDWVMGQDCQDALKSCDIIFSCTDDHSGRILLNRLAYFYHIPLIDMGLEISLTENEPKEINAIIARVTVVFPGKQCLLCRKVVNTHIAREEVLKRTDPEAYQRQKEEAYVTGEGNPSPAVITFTNETSTMAVNELLHRITGFKNSSNTDHFVNFINIQNQDSNCIRKPGSEINEDCPICSKNDYWGIGDIIPFLDMAN